MQWAVLLLGILATSSVYSADVTIELDTAVTIGSTEYDPVDFSDSEIKGDILNLTSEQAPMLKDSRRFEYDGELPNKISYDLDSTDFNIWNLSGNGVYQKQKISISSSEVTQFPINLDGSFLYFNQRNKKFAYNAEDGALYTWSISSAQWFSMPVLLGLGEANVLSYRLVGDTLYLDIEGQGIYKVEDDIAVIESEISAENTYFTFYKSEGLFQILPKYSEKVVDGEVKQTLETYQYLLYDSSAPDNEYIIWGVNSNKVTSIAGMEVHDGVIFIFSGENNYFQIRYLGYEEVQTARIKTPVNMAQFLGYYRSSNRDLFWVRTSTGVDQIYEWVNSRFELDSEFSLKGVDIEIGNDLWDAKPHALLAHGRHRFIAFTSSNHAYLAQIYKDDGPSGLDTLVKEYISDNQVWMYLQPHLDQDRSFGFGLIAPGSVNTYNLNFDEYSDVELGVDIFESVVSREGQFEEGETQLDFTEVATDSFSFVERNSDSSSDEEGEKKEIQRAELSGTMNFLYLLLLFLLVGGGLLRPTKLLYPRLKSHNFLE